MDASQQQSRRTRHKWFPVFVLVAAALWWWRQASYAQYQTLFHLVVLLLSVVLIALWFLVYGGARRHVRLALIGGLAVALGVFFIAFRPVYNGDMGVYRWRF